MNFSKLFWVLCLTSITMFNLYGGSTKHPIPDAEEAYEQAANGEIDLWLEMQIDPSEPSIYTNYTIELTITNDSDNPATGVEVRIPQPEGANYQGGQEYTATQGKFNPYTNNIWTVGTLAGNAKATIEVNYFLLSDLEVNHYTEVANANENDADSTPNNGTSPQVNEDDEAVIILNKEDTSPTCELAVEVIAKDCFDNGTPDDASDDRFSFTIIVTGNPDVFPPPYQAEIDGRTFSGRYGEPAEFFSFPISDGAVEFQITDQRNDCVSSIIAVSPTATCSGDNNNDQGCGFNTSYTAIPDNFTPSYPVILETGSGYYIDINTRNNSGLKTIRIETDASGVELNRTERETFISSVSASATDENKVTVTEIDGDAIFERTVDVDYPSITDIFSVSAFKVSDGYLVGGVIVDTERPESIFVGFTIKLDNNLNVVKQALLPEIDDTDRLVELIAEDAAGGLYLRWFTSGAFYMTKIDKDLNFLWQQGVLGDLPSSDLNGIEYSAVDNAIYIAVIDNQRAEVTKIDATSGERLYELNIGNIFSPGSEFTRGSANGLILLPEGGFVTGGFFSEVGVFPGIEGFEYGQIRADGSRVWSERLLGEPLNLRPIRQTSDGGFIFAGFRNNNGLDEPVVLKTTALGKLTPSCQIQACDCTFDYEPVCSSEGITYLNACKAECAGVFDYTSSACVQNERCRHSFSNAVAPATLAPRETVEVTVTVTNETDKATLAEPVFFGQTIGIGIREIGQLTPFGEGLIPPLSAGESKEITITVTAPDPLYFRNNAPPEDYNGVGAFYVYTIGNGVFSGFLNCGEAIEIEPNYSNADLAVEYVDNKECFGDDLIPQVAIQLTNNGNKTVKAPIYIELGPLDFIDIDNPAIINDAFFQRGFWKIEEPLAAGASLILEHPYALPQNFGGEQLELKATLLEGVSNVVDISPNDNEAVTTFVKDANCGEPSTGEVDLALTLTAQKPNIGPFQNSKFTLTINNSGSSTATGIAVDFSNPNVVLADGEQPVASQGTFNFFGDQIWRVGDLGAGESATLEVNYFFLAEPFLYAEVSKATGDDVDSTPGNGDGQTAEEDDEAVFGGGVIGNKLPDLRPEKLTDETIILTVGESSTVSFEVINDGDGASAAHQVSVYLTNPLFVDDVLLIGSIRVEGQGANTSQSVTVPVTVPENLDPVLGYGILFEVDTTDEVNETDEENNRVSEPVQLITDDLKLADLTLTNLEVTASASQGTVVPYEIDVQNIGDKTAEGDYIIGAFLSTDNQLSNDDIEVGTIPTGNTPVGTIADVPGAITVPADLAVGEYYLILQTDRDNAIIESNESNNTVRAKLAITDGGTGGDDIDLELSLSAANPNVGVYMNTVFTLTLSNTGGAAAKNVEVALPLPAGKIVLTGGTTPTIEQGTYNAFGDQIWKVGSLGAGQTVTLKIDLFLLAKPFVFTEVVAATGNDPDSTPNNGNGSTANEDDEAIFGGQVGQDCNIILTVYGKTCDDNGTPDNPEDDTFGFKFKATGRNVGATFGVLSPINTFAPVPYGEELEVDNLPIKGGAVDIIVVDTENASCSTTLSVSPPSTCSGGTGGDVDLELTTTAPINFTRFTNVEVTYTITNTGTEKASNVVIHAPLPEGTVNSFNIVSKGVFRLFNQQWTVGTLGAGESATLTWTLFALAAESINGYAQVITASPTDIDSTPNNGNGSTANEDDETVYVLKSASLQPTTDNSLQSTSLTSTQLFPTITNSAITLQWMTDMEQEVNVAIYNLQGQQVMSTKVLTYKGLNQQDLEVSTLSAGTYFLKVETDRGGETLRFVKM